MEKIMNTYWLKGVEWCDSYENVTMQEVWSDEFSFLFHVSDLVECSENAMIEKDLFDANDLMNAIQFGIALAKQGFDNVGICFEGEEE